jgi:hypothetical protein
VHDSHNNTPVKRVKTKVPHGYRVVSGAANVYQFLTEFFETHGRENRRNAERIAIEMMRAFSGIELKIPKEQQQCKSF